jgi:hypothetical protein
MLARAEIGQLVLVDPGCLKASGHQRNHATKHSDLASRPAPTKAFLAARLVREVSPSTQVIAFVGDILHENVFDELVRCDFILGCTDSNYARAALGDLANHYLLPVLDLAVQMRAENGRLTEQLAEVAYYGPGLPCPWCRGGISVEGIRYETATPEEREWKAAAAAEAEARGVDGAQYWGGTPPQELTVGYLTSAVGSLGAGYAQNMLLGSGKLPAARFQFDIGMKGFAFVTDERGASDACSCQKYVGWADQGGEHRSVSLPRHFGKEALLL